MCNDTIMFLQRDLEVYQNILETESEELKLKIEQMRELSKVFTKN